MTLGIIVGMKREAVLVRAWAPSACIVMSGARKEGTLQALHILKKKNVKAIISLGLAGGLSENAQVGDVIVAQNIYTDSQVYTAHAQLKNALYAASKAHLGDILHSDYIIPLTQQKKKLAAHYPMCMALDMESGLAAEFCMRYHLPFAAIRVVCDTVDFSLPPLAQQTINENGKVSVKAMVKSLITQPGQIKNLMALAVHAHKAERKLKTYLSNVPQPNIAIFSQNI